MARLTLRGRDVSKKIPPSVQVIKKFLDDSRKTELFATEDLYKMAGVGRSAIYGHADHPSLKGYVYVVNSARKTFYWGHPKAIVAFIKMQKQDRGAR